MSGRTNKTPLRKQLRGMNGMHVRRQPYIPPGGSSHPEHAPVRQQARQTNHTQKHAHPKGSSEHTRLRLATHALVLLRGSRTRQGKRPARDQQEASKRPTLAISCWPHTRSEKKWAASRPNSSPRGNTVTPCKTHSRARGWMWVSVASRERILQDNGTQQHNQASTQVSE